MNTGRISYNMTQRSVRKPMKSGGSLLPGFMQYRDCAAFSQNGQNVITSVLSAAGRLAEMPEILFYRGCGQILCQGGSLGAVSASFVLPEDIQEAWLAARIKTLTGLCGAEHASFAQTFAAVSKQVAAPVLTLTFTAAAPAEPETYRPGPKDALLAVGHAGMAGAAIVARERCEELTKHYAGGFIDAAADFLRELSPVPAVRCLQGSYLFGVQEGGVLAALWYLADGLGLGFDIDMKKIPIRQETVEICEYYRLNPYCLAGDGMILAVTDRPEQMLQRCRQAGCQGTLLGYMTGEKGRILRNEDEVRYLDKPAADELERI